MAEPPTALEAWEAVVREWDVGFCGFRGGALPDGDRGRGVTVGMGDGEVVSSPVEVGGLPNWGSSLPRAPDSLCQEGVCLYLHL